MAPTASPAIRYLILLFGDGAPLFFGPFMRCQQCTQGCSEDQCQKQEETLNGEARKQKKLYPTAKLTKLTIKSSKEIHTEPLE